MIFYFIITNVFASWVNSLRREFVESSSRVFPGNFVSPCFTPLFIPFSENKFAVGSGAKTVCICYYEQDNDWYLSSVSGLSELFDYACNPIYFQNQSLISTRIVL